MCLESEYEFLTNRFPEVEWSMMGDEQNGICIAKVQNRPVVSILYPSRQFIINTDIGHIYCSRHSFTGKTKWILDNANVLMSLDDNLESLGNILTYIASDLRNYYFELKKEEIYAAKNIYKEKYISFCNHDCN